MIHGWLEEGRLGRWRTSSRSVDKKAGGTKHRCKVSYYIRGGGREVEKARGRSRQINGCQTGREGLLCMGPVFSIALGQEGIPRSVLSELGT